MGGGWHGRRAPRPAPFSRSQAQRVTVIDGTGTDPIRVAQVVATQCLHQACGLGTGPGVVPEHRGPQRSAARVEDDETVLLCRDADGGDVAREPGGCERVPERRPPQPPGPSHEHRRCRSPRGTPDRPRRSARSPLRSRPRSSTGSSCRPRPPAAATHVLLALVTPVGMIRPADLGVGLCRHRMASAGS